ncbi:O-antigen ligase family protein [Staphylococcus saprophyticus]|uniref:O-antigen ligase family protein n=1 Tax=Staphylococcus saprophyticus TaxID=29385 RepID=UPI001012DE76|nr:O-antigen ligase family protein [Staphylococcus saprophyticus]RXS15622.1 O-antigen ligase domain-containing protein [Staphylococcus saprophyticus]
MKTYTKLIFSKEILFVLFLYAGFYKSVVPFSGAIDITIVLLFASISITLYDTIKDGYLYKQSLISIIIFIFFIVYIFTSYFYSPSANSLTKSLHFSLTSGWAFIGSFLIIKSNNSFNKVFKGIIILALISSIFALKEYFNNTIHTQLNVFGSDYLALGRLLGISILILLANILLIKQSITNKIFTSMTTLFLLLTLIVSGGRAPLLFLIITILIFLLFQVNLNNKTLKYNKLLPSFIVFLITVVLIFFKSNLAIFETFKTRLLFLTTQSGGGASASGRIDRFKIAFHMFKDSPIYGKGIDSFSKYYGMANDYPHNIFLEIAAELGIIGILIFSIILIYSLYNLHLNFQKDKQNKLLCWKILLIFIYTLLNANISGDIIGNRMLFASLGFMIAFSNIYRHNLSINKS